MKKENKKEYLRRILDIKPGDPGYAEMDTYIKKYNTFMRALNYEKCAGTPVEKIFVDMHNNGLTVTSIVAKGRNQEDIIHDMKDALLKSNEYYDTVLKPKYIEAAYSSCHSLSDIDLDLLDRKRINSVVGPYSNLEKFLMNFKTRWRQANSYLYETIYLVFSEKNGISKQLPLRCNEFSDVVEEEIKYYNEHKPQYPNGDERHNEFYYHGKNDNPYKNLYLYYLNAYMKQYYVFDLPDISVDKFYSLKNFEGISELIDKNNIYGLRDIANLHSLMSGLPSNKIYENMKKKFNKLAFMMSCKKTGKYAFPDVTLPLAAYEYYKKKNHIESTHGPSLCSFDPLIVYVYAPILRAMILKKERDLATYIKYREFIISEYKGLFSKVDDGTQCASLYMLLESPIRLKYRYMGLDVS